MTRRHVMLLLPATTLALSLQTQAPPRVVVDLDVVADTLPLESEVYLSALQSLRPEGPWRDQRDLPQHRWRTFDLARKYHRVLRELRVVRPADACMMLRLLFEEDEVGRRAIAARQDPSGTKWKGGGWAPTEGELQGVRPGTRPLTAGEVVENWDEVLGPRCFARWRSEDADFQLADIDDAVAAAARVEIRRVSRRRERAVTFCFPRRRPRRSASRTRRPWPTRWPGGPTRCARCARRSAREECIGARLWY